MQTRVFVLLEYIDLGVNLDWFDVCWKFRLLLQWFFETFCWKDNLSFLCLGCFRLGLDLFCNLLGDEQGTSVREFDKGKIVKSLLLIFLYLFCIFLFIITMLCLFQCFRLILEENRRKKLKWVENKQIWKISTQRGNSRQIDRPLSVDRFWQRSAPRR